MPTLFNLEQIMRVKEIFEIVKAHLIKQNSKCTDDNNSCLYRNDEGKSCAVGALIPDHLYKSSMEGHDVGYLIGTNPQVAEYLGFVDRTRCRRVESPDYTRYHLLADLQYLHDEVPTDQWGDKLNALEKSVLEAEEYDETGHYESYNDLF